MTIPRPNPIRFGAEIRDADGARLHPGMLVAFGDRTGEIVGSDDGTLRLLTDEGSLFTAPAVECLVRAEAAPGAVTRGWKVETDESRPTALVIPARAAMVRPTDALSFLPPPGRSKSRWVKACARTLRAMHPDDAARIARTELAIPSVEQPLVDASLPPDLDRVIAVPAGGRGATAAAELARLWLVGDSTRTIRTVDKSSRRRLSKAVPTGGLTAVVEPGARGDRRITARLARTGTAIRSLRPRPDGVIEVDHR